MEPSDKSRACCHSPESNLDLILMMHEKQTAINLLIDEQRWETPTAVFRPLPIILPLFCRSIHFNQISQISRSSSKRSGLNGSIAAALGTIFPTVFGLLTLPLSKDQRLELYFTNIGQRHACSVFEVAGAWCLFCAHPQKCRNYSDPGPVNGCVEPPKQQAWLMCWHLSFLVAIENARHSRSLCHYR